MRHRQEERLTQEERLQQARVKHIDFCVAAYHLFHQSTVFKMDAWNETLVYDSQTYRNQVLSALRDAVGYSAAHERVAKYYPQGVQPHLEPIAQDYSLMNPTQPVAVYDGEVYIYFEPQPWMKKISRFSVCKRRDANAPWNIDSVNGSTGFRHVKNFGGTNNLYCFEGATGHQAQGGEGLSSIMGFVHWDKENGSVNIAFRGSRSGDATRNFLDGFLGSVGNPDWVTDMKFKEFIKETTISNKGMLCAGFARTVLSCLPAITAILKKIYNECELHAPTHINKVTVTGHSLGGALASLMGSALLFGNYREELLTHLLQSHARAQRLGEDPAFAKRDSFLWALMEPEIFTYASPQIGSQKFASQFDRYNKFHRILILSDPVTMGGRPMSFDRARHPKTRTPVRDPSWYEIDPKMHEPNEIRRGLSTRTSPYWRQYGNFTDLVRNHRDVVAMWRDSFKWDHFTVIANMLVDVYLTKHHQAKRRFLPWSKSVSEIKDSYRQAYQQLNFRDDMGEMKGLMSGSSHDKGIFIVAYIQRFLDYLSAELHVEDDGGISFPLSNDPDVVDKCKQFIKGLRHYAGASSQASTVVKYIHFHTTLLTFLLDGDRNCYTVYRILKNAFKGDRIAPLVSEGSINWAGAVGQIGAVQAVNAMSMGRYSR